MSEEGWVGQLSGLKELRVFLTSKNSQKIQNLLTARLEKRNSGMAVKQKGRLWVVAKAVI